jgi:hypothetical protein
VQLCLSCNTFAESIRANPYPERSYFFGLKYDIGAPRRQETASLSAPGSGGGIGDRSPTIHRQGYAAFVRRTGLQVMRRATVLTFFGNVSRASPALALGRRPLAPIRGRRRVHAGAFIGLSRNAAMLNRSPTVQTARGANMQTTTEDFADYETQAVADDDSNELVPRAMRGMSRMAYTSSYWLSYGVVYATVFAAHSLPQENPVMHGLRDGARAAMDALKSED